MAGIAGFEGSGTVVESGGGMMARFLKGGRVACHAADRSITGGTWAEYLVTPAHACVPLRKQVDMEQGATMLVNPFTAWALGEEARRGGHSAVVKIAAANSISRMMLRVSRKISITFLKLIRCH